MVRFNKSLVQFANARTSDSRSFEEIKTIVEQKDGLSPASLPAWTLPSSTMHLSSLSPSSLQAKNAISVDEGINDTNAAIPQEATPTSTAISKAEQATAAKIPQSFFQRFFRSSRG